MWRYKQPGFALHLLWELQKQQQCSLHCDALLQTEGVSIPVHSCVLSALSPVFCRAFTNAPSHQVGQSRLVQLEAVGAQALMKLVGFMYSGEMQGESLDEQQEVIDIAYKLGFSNFLEGKQKQVNRSQNKTSCWREIGLQTVETGGRKKDASVQNLSGKPSFSHSGTQTDGARAHFADTCFISEPELSIDLPDEITDVASQCNSIPPDSGLAWIDEIVAHSPSNSTEALARGHAKHQQTQKGKKRAKISNKGGTQISLKIKMKRQKSGELWKIVSVQGESTVDESKICGSSDDPPMTHSPTEIHKSSEELQLSPSPSLTCQNLETVTLTPPADLTTHLPDKPTRSPTQHPCHLDPVPPSSLLQIPPLSPAFAHPKESEEQFSKLLEMVTEGLNILPSVTTEGDSSMYAHLDQNLEKCATLASTPTSYLCFRDHNLGVMGVRRPGTSEQRQAGSQDQSSCRKSDVKNIASVASYPTSYPYLPTSPCSRQKKNTHSSFTPPCPIVPAKLNFANKSLLEHKNVVDIKTVLNTFLEGADSYAQSGKQTVSDGDEDCNMQNQMSRTAISNAAQDDPTPVGKLCPEQLCGTDHMLVWESSDIGQPPTPSSSNWVDFSEMRLPRCLSPLTSETSEATGISTPDSLRLLSYECSSCLSATHTNLQPSLRYTSSSFQPQALPGETNQQNSSCTSQHVNHLHCKVVGRNSCPVRLNEDRDREASLYESEENKTKARSFENNPLNGTEDNVLDGQENGSVVRERSTARHSGQTDAQPVILVNPCSVNMKNIRNVENIQDINNPGRSEGVGCLKARKTLSIGLKSQQNLAQVSHPFRCKDLEACQRDVLKSKQTASLMANCGHGRPLLKRACSKAVMEDFSKIRKLNSSSVTVNASSFSVHQNLAFTQMSKESVPRHGIGILPEVQKHPLGLAQTKVNDLIIEHEKKKEPGPEQENPISEPEKVILNVNQSGEENKQPQRYSGLFNKASFCDKIFHQTVFSAGTSLTPNCLPDIKHQERSILQTTDRKIRTTLPPSLTCKKVCETPEPYHMSTKQIMDNFKETKKDTIGKNGIERRVAEINKPEEGLEENKDKKVDSEVGIEQNASSSRNTNGYLVNGNFAKGTEISASTVLSIHKAVDLSAASHLWTLPPARDLNSNFGMENILQNELTTTSLQPFRPEIMTEKPKTDEQIPERLSQASDSNKPTEVKLIKTKELHLVGTESTQTVNLGRQVEGKTNTARETEYVEISRMIKYEPELSDIEVDVMDESAKLSTCHGNDRVSTEGPLDIIDVEMFDEMDNDGEPVAHEEEIDEQQVRSTEVEVVQPDEATVEITSNMISIEAPSIQHGEEPLTSSSLSSLSSSVMFVPDVNTESAEDCSSDEEELVVDDITDSPVKPCTGVGTQSNAILEEEDEEEKEDKEEEEEEDVDVTGEESS